MGPRLHIPETHPGQANSDEDLCTIFVLVLVTTMLTAGLLIACASGHGQELAQRLPCLPPPAARARRTNGARSRPLAGGPEYLWNVFGLSSLNGGLKEP